MSPKPLTSAQIRAARALVRWSAQELATKTEVGVTTIRRSELTASETKLTRVNDQAIRRVLEAAGVEFIDENGGGPGVRLRDVQKSRRARAALASCFWRRVTVGDLRVPPSANEAASTFSRLTVPWPVRSGHDRAARAGRRHADPFKVGHASGGSKTARYRD